jgi:hypothetical protein
MRAVLQEALGRRPAPSVAADLPPQCDAAELQMRGAARLLARRAGFGRGPRLLVQVKAHLLIEIAVDLPAVPQERKPPPKFTER